MVQTMANSEIVLNPTGIKVKCFENPNTVYEKVAKVMY